MTKKFNLRRIIGYGTLCALAIFTILAALDYLNKNYSEKQILYMVILLTAFTSLIGSLVLIFSARKP